MDISMDIHIHGKPGNVYWWWLPPSSGALRN